MCSSLFNDLQKEMINRFKYNLNTVVGEKKKKKRQTSESVCFTIYLA